MFRKIKAKLDEVLLEIEIAIEEAVGKGDQALVDELTNHETRVKAHIGDLEAKLAALGAILVALISASPATLSFSMASPDPQSIATTIYPIDASNPSLSFSSQDTSITKVDEKGIVTPVAIGTTQIVIASADGNAKTFVFVSVAA